MNPMQMLQGILIGVAMADSGGVKDPEKKSQVGLITGLLGSSPVSLLVAKAMVDKGTDDIATTTTSTRTGTDDITTTTTSTRPKKIP